MSNQATDRHINILPGVGVLGVLRHVNYQPWYALAEFVDNSVQSATARDRQLRRTDGEDYQLAVTIDYDGTAGGRLTVRDNAAGISDREYDRAFKTGERPPEVANLAEFGMGLKSAACWFAQTWSVRSKALGESVERYVEFDVDDIVVNHIGELPVTTTIAEPDAHYTEIVMSKLNQRLHARTVGKIKDHLGGMYRHFTRHGQMLLIYNGDPLTYEEPRILKAPFFKEPDGAKRLWRKPFDLSLPNGRRVHGFAAIREVGNLSSAGFAIFRRNRLIQGSGDLGYRPERIFRKPNSYSYQRLFGELVVEGFGVTHTKDSIQWDGQEDVVLDSLAVALNAPPMQMLDQAEGYRVRPPRMDFGRATKQVFDAVEAVERDLGQDITSISRRAPADPTPPPSLPATSRPFTREYAFSAESIAWRVRLECVHERGIRDWLTIADYAPPAASGERQVTLRLSLLHPFMERFVGVDPDRLEPVLRLAMAIGLAELVSRDSGAKQAGIVRTHVNELLRGALAK